MKRIQSREKLIDVVFHENKYRKDKFYLQTFLGLDDETIIPTFSIQTTNFRFEYTNQTGKQIKDRIKDYLL